MVRVAIIPGIAHAKLDKSGRNALPWSPTRLISLSRRNAARAIYPVSSKIERNKKRSKIWGKKTTTPPTPAIMPSTSKSVKIPTGISARTKSPNAPKPLSSKSIGRFAHEKIVWKTNSKIPIKISKPKNLCVKTLSIFSETLRSRVSFGLTASW